MGFFDRFRRTLTQDRFAKLLIQRLRAAGEAGEVVYDAPTFTLRLAGTESITYLGNVYAEYKRSDSETRERVLRTFLSTWFTAGFKLPKDLDDARPDLLAAVRTRAYFEIGVPLMSVMAGGAPTPPERLVYAELGECLAVAPVYDLPTSIRQLDQRDLDGWGITLYEALEIAKQNLLETTRECAKAGGVYMFAHGDSHDAARLLLTELLASMEFDGLPVAMAPNREMLLLAGSEDPDGLLQMVEMAKKALEHERGISGIALLLEDGEWSPWLPEEASVAYPELALLRAQTMLGEYEQQRELLHLLHSRSGDSVFVSSFNATQDRKTGRVQSYCIWPQGTAALLPRTDRIVLSTTGPDGKPNGIAAAADWDQVLAEVGPMLTPEPGYPELWRVEDFPAAPDLGRIGIAPWASE